MNSNKPTTPHHVDVVVKYFFPLMAGIENNVANVYGYMVENGWDVSLHTTRNLPNKKDCLKQQEVIRGINVMRYKWHWFGIVPNIDWNNTEAVCLHNFDIFPHSWILAYAGIRKLMRLRTPKVFLTPHGGFTPGWETFPAWQRLLKKSYQSILGIHLINNVVDAYRCVSEWEANESIKHGVKKNKIYVITNGIEDEALMNIEREASLSIKRNVKGFGKYLLQIGRVHPIKNQATTIKALKHLPSDINYVIAGPITDLDYKKELDKLINKLGLEKRVKFVGVITGVDKYYLLKHCLCYCHLAVWESYCNTVHESMSQGCICIVAEDTAMVELIKNEVSGFVVPPFDHLQVSKLVNYIIQNQKSPRILSMKEKCIKFTRGHSWRNVSARVSNMYEKNMLLNKIAH